MKKLITILFLFILIKLSGQDSILVDLGSGTDINNWNAVNSLNDNNLNYYGSGLASSIDITLVNTAFGSSGNSSGTCMPAQVSQMYQYVDNASINITFSGLDNATNYTIWLFGSRAAVAESRITDYTIEGVTKSLETQDNACNWVIFTNITPTSNQILITVANNNHQYGYINAIRLVEQSGSTPIQGNCVYVSNTGSDLNDGSTPELAKQNLTQSLINSLSSVDSLLLHRNSRWDEVNLDFTNINDFYIGDYGSGELPVLSGAREINTFTDQGGNIWQATVNETFPRSANTEVVSPNGITINGILQEIAHKEIVQVDTQSSGVNHVILTTGDTYSNNVLNDAFVTVQPQKWCWHTSRITSNTGNYLNISPSLGYNPNNSHQERYAYVLNYDGHLTNEGNWTFKNNTLKVYTTSNPNTLNTRFTISDTLVYFDNCNNIKIENIRFEQSNHIGICVEKGSNVDINNVEMYAISGYGIRMYDSGDNWSIANSKFQNLYNHAAFIRYSGSGVMSNNYFKNVGNVPWLANYEYGAMGNNGGAIKLQELKNGDVVYMQYNIFDSVGLACQNFTSMVDATWYFRYNLITNYGYPHGDVGAIYAASEVYDKYEKKFISNNIVLDALDFGVGKWTSNSHPDHYPHAIYLDEDALGFTVDSNSIENASYAYYMNRNHLNDWTDGNIVNGNKYLSNDGYNGIYMKDQSIGASQSAAGSADRDSVLRNNVVMTGDSWAAMYVRHTVSSTYNAYTANDNNSFYTDYNKISYPFGTSKNVGRYVYNWAPGSGSSYSLAQMQANTDNFSANSSDANTQIDPQGIMYSDVSGSVTEDEFVQFFTNFSASTRTVDLGNCTFKDIDGNNVSGSTTVAPFYSKILFYASGDINTVEEERYIDYNLVPMSQNNCEIDTIYYSAMPRGKDWRMAFNKALINYNNDNDTIMPNSPVPNWTVRINRFIYSTGNDTINHNTQGMEIWRQKFNKAVKDVCNY